MQSNVICSFLMYYKYSILLFKSLGLFSKFFLKEVSYVYLHLFNQYYSHKKVIVCISVHSNVLLCFLIFLRRL